jgi:hypothetical protein
MLLTSLLILLVLLTGILYQSFPLVFSLDYYSASLARSFITECFMWSYVVVVDLVALQNWSSLAF